MHAKVRNMDGPSSLEVPIPNQRLIDCTILVNHDNILLINIKREDANRNYELVAINARLRPLIIFLPQ